MSVIIILVGSTFVFCFSLSYAVKQLSVSKTCSANMLNIHAAEYYLNCNKFCLMQPSIEMLVIS